LVYDSGTDLGAPADVDDFSPYDDFDLTPVDGEALYETADYTVTLDLTMDNLGDGAN
jgi:iron transport multicopper oxidase